MERESARIMEELAALPDRVAAVFLSRPIPFTMTLSPRAPCAMPGRSG